MRCCAQFIWLWRTQDEIKRKSMSTTSQYARRISPEIASLINDHDRDGQRPANHCGKESTRPRQAAETLRRNWSSFGQGNGSSHSGSWRWNVPTGALRIFGFDPEKLRPPYSMFLERIHPEDRPLFEQTLGGLLWEDGGSQCRWSNSIPISYATLLSRELKMNNASPPF